MDFVAFEILIRTVAPHSLYFGEFEIEIDLVFAGLPAPVADNIYDLIDQFFYFLRNFHSRLKY